jgi:arylsulfatase A-like enzyme
VWLLLRVRNLLPAVVLLLVGSAVAGCSQGPPPQPNIVIILVDTLRRDHLQPYGYDRPTSATIDSLASAGWVFENHIASASQTVPSTLTMLLSLNPAEHGFRHLEVGQFSDHRPRYPEGLHFLAEVLREAGYATGGFVANPFLGEENGFDQGFDVFGYTLSHDGGELTEGALHFLNGRTHQPERPFFLYLHYFDVHWPYAPPEAYLRHFPVPEGAKTVYKNGLVSGVRERDLQGTVSLYDAGIAYVDDLIGRVVERLDEMDVLEDSIVLVTSDHGEEFLEHGGLGHGTTVYGELVRVPLIISYPKQLGPGRRVTHLSRHLDLAPTLLDMVGVPQPAQYRGASMLEPASVAYAEDGPWRAVYRADHNLVVNRETGSRELFAVADELDQRPLDSPEATSRLTADLDQYISLEGAGPVIPIPQPGEMWSAGELRELRALGYVADDSPDSQAVGGEASSADH